MLLLQTLGGLAIASDTGETDPRPLQKKPLALLALLSRAHAHGMSRDRVMSLLWPEADSERGRQVLPRTLATLHAEQQVLLTTQVRRLEHQLRDRVLPTPDVQRLVWIPGVGALVAYTLALEIDDITRFPTVRHFHSYCRLVPGAEDSAATRKQKRSREGNRYLKLAFHHAAVRAAQYNPEIQAEYRRLIRRKGKAIARALIAKELGSIVYQVLKRQEDFNGRFRERQLTRMKPRRWPRLASPPA
jgi:transposase